MPTSNAELNKAPALRISHIVRGRRKEGNRVKYFVDPEGHKHDRAIPEDVVLKRWRKRTMASHSFHGFRLGPNTWKAIAHTFGTFSPKLLDMPVKEIAAKISSSQPDRIEKHLWLPEAKSLWLMCQAIGAERLEQILRRHTARDRQGRFGTPDLFLYAIKSGNSKPSFYRMVEVKKPFEEVSADQKEEIEFLRSIGVPARVLRLIER